MLETLQDLESSGFLGGNGHSGKGSIIKHFQKSVVVPTKPASYMANAAAKMVAPTAPPEACALKCLTNSPVTAKKPRITYLGLRSL